MSLIRNVLDVIEQSGDAVEFGRLSRMSGIQPTALQGILELCVRTGYLLAEGDDPAGACNACAAASACGFGCKVEGVSYRRVVS